MNWLYLGVLLSLPFFPGSVNLWHFSWCGLDPSDPPRLCFTSNSNTEVAVRWVPWCIPPFTSCGRTTLGTVLACGNMGCKAVRRSASLNASAASLHGVVALNWQAVNECRLDFQPDMGGKRHCNRTSVSWDLSWRQGLSFLRLSASAFWAWQDN